MNHMAMLICSNLHLDMPAGGDSLFQNKLTIAERTLGFPPGGHNGFGQCRLFGDQTHPAPTTAHRRLNHNRQTNLTGLANQDRIALVCTIVAFDTGHPGSGNSILGCPFAAHECNRLWRRANENQACGFAA